MSNRQLKFRVWDEKYHCWDNSLITCYPNEVFKKQGRTIQWSTGVEDQNGNPIYEGDMVVDKQGVSYKVVYDSKYARFDLIVFGENKLCGRCYFTQVHEGKLLEVVGNIFEHKHLIEK